MTDGRWDRSSAEGEDTLHGLQGRKRPSRAETQKVPSPDAGPCPGCYKDLRYFLKSFVHVQEEMGQEPQQFAHTPPQEDLF